MIPNDVLVQLLEKISSISLESRLVYVQDAQEKNVPLETYLVKEGLLDETAMYETWAKELSLPFHTGEDIVIPPALCNLLPRSVAQAHETVPFGQDEKNNLSLATARPFDAPFFQSVERLIRAPIRITVATPATIRRLIEQCVQPLREDVAKLKTEKSGIAPELASNDTAGQEAPIIRLVETIADHALLENSSDIHIEPTEKDVRIRFRIDGLLRDVMRLPISVQAGIIARLKILSHLKLDEHRLPQDGRFSLKTDSGITAVRLSVLPTYYGEKAVLRLLREGARPVTLQGLGFLPDDQEKILRALASPHGMILVTGPTGSGKTTTLYTVLSILNQPRVNICTIEDPIEYKLEHITQSQIQPAIGFTFATGLRALLRQDPDIIMVGEIRDEETSSIAVNAAMTGHLLLSTLHTNSAVGAIARLADLKVPIFLIASTTRLLIGQRLVRKLCDHCKKTAPLSEDLQKNLTANIDEKRLKEILIDSKVLPDTHDLKHIAFGQATGCEHCDNEGYEGRLGIYEVLYITEAFRQAIRLVAPEEETLTVAKKDGMRSMLEDGLIKAAQGLTTIEEILRATRET